MTDPDDKPPYIVPALHKFGMTEFHMAAYHGDLLWVQDCLARGLDCEIRDDGGNTPLHWAADMALVDGDREDVVAALIAAGADVHARRSGGETVLMVAVLAGNDDVIRQLLRAGADAQARNDKGKTAHDYTHSRRVKAALGPASDDAPRPTPRRGRER